MEGASTLRTNYKGIFRSTMHVCRGHAICRMSYERIFGRTTPVRGGGEYVVHVDVEGARLARASNMGAFQATTPVSGRSEYDVHELHRGRSYVECECVSRELHALNENSHAVLFQH